MNLFNYINYRKFLNEWLKDSKSGALKERMNASGLANLLRVHPTFISQVLIGKKDLSLEHALDLSKHLSLNLREKEYFLLLVQHEKAGSHDLKLFFENQIKAAREEQLNLGKNLSEFKTLDDEKKAIFYSSWIYAAVWAVCGIGSGFTAEKVAAYFQLDRKDAIDILTFLTSVALLNQKDGVYTMGSQHIHVSNESPFVGRHHTNWRLRALHRLDRLQKEELIFTAPMSIAQKDFLVLRDKVTALIKEVVEIAKDSEAEDLACLNIDLFWPAK